MTATTYGQVQISGDRLAEIRQKTQSDAHQILDLVFCYYRRASQRRQLAAMDERMLRDIGISRDEALAEAAKPFWRG